MSDDIFTSKTPFSAQNFLENFYDWVIVGKFVFLGALRSVRDCIKYFAENLGCKYDVATIPFLRIQFQVANCPHLNFIEG